MPSETIGLIAERYASALFELAESRSQLDQVAADLAVLRSMIRDSADLRRLMDSPVLSRAEQGKAMAAVVAAAGLGASVANFVGLVARNRRLFALSAMIEAYMRRLAALRGEIGAKVASAVPLTEAQLGRLSDALKAAFGAKVAVDAAVDPALIGGLVVKVGSRMVDSSLRTKLQHMKIAMKGVG